MIPRLVDVAIAGGGPAGLAVAIEAASRGLTVLVLERRHGIPDKACGEGVLPGGVAHLARLDVVERLGPDDAHRFAGIRWIGEDGVAVEGRFPPGHFGLGVRRTALVAALAERAREAGALVHGGVEVRGFTAWGLRAPEREGPLRLLARARRLRPPPDDAPSAEVRLDTTAGPVRARLLVAADGLASPLRRAAGLERPTASLRRFGVRRHYRLAPWSELVEVHWADGVEAYVTPVGDRRVGVALLHAPDRTGPAGFDALLARFPALRRRLHGAPVDGRDRGAGPLAHEVRDPIAPGLVLVGDAAGYLDAITGEGISLALGDAAALGATLPGVMAAGATCASLAPYARALARSRRRYLGGTAPVLLLARRPALRRRVIAFLAAHPPLFAGMLQAIVAAESPRIPAVAPLPRPSPRRRAPR